MADLTLTDRLKATADKIDLATKGPWLLGDENNSWAEVVIGETATAFGRDSRHEECVISRDEMLANAHATITARNEAPSLLREAAAALASAEQRVQELEARTKVQFISAVSGLRYDDPRSAGDLCGIVFGDVTLYPAWPDQIEKMIERLGSVDDEATYRATADILDLLRELADDPRPFWCVAEPAASLQGESDGRAPEFDPKTHGEPFITCHHCNVRQQDLGSHCQNCYKSFECMGPNCTGSDGCDCWEFTYDEKHILWGGRPIATITRDNDYTTVEAGGWDGLSSSDIHEEAIRSSIEFLEKIDGGYLLEYVAELKRRTENALRQQEARAAAEPSEGGASE